MDLPEGAIQMTDQEQRVWDAAYGMSFALEADREGDANSPARVSWCARAVAIADAAVRSLREGER